MEETHYCGFCEKEVIAVDYDPESGFGVCPSCGSSENMEPLKPT